MLTSRKANRQRLIILLGVNMRGNEQLKPPMAGKRKKPRCFKNVKSHPLEYETDSNA